MKRLLNRFRRRRSQDGSTTPVSPTPVSQTLPEPPTPMSEPPPSPSRGTTLRPHNLPPIVSLATADNLERAVKGKERVVDEGEKILEPLQMGAVEQGGESSEQARTGKDSLANEIGQLLERLEHVAASAQIGGVKKEDTGQNDLQTQVRGLQTRIEELHTKLLDQVSAPLASTAEQINA